MARELSTREPPFSELKGLADQLRLPCERSMQDWEIEVADAERVGEFLEHYGSAPLSPPLRLVLGRLILASLDEALDAGHGGEHFDAVADVLLSDPKLHSDTIHYWSCSDQSSLDDCFPSTSLVRTVLAQVSTKPQG